MTGGGVLVMQGHGSKQGERDSMGMTSKRAREWQNRRRLM
jgi:hypothetical protein